VHGEWSPLWGDDKRNGGNGQGKRKPTLLIRWNQMIPNSKRKSDCLSEGKRGGVKAPGKEIAEWSVSCTTENVRE